MQASECSYRSAISHYARSVTMRSDGLDVSSVCAPSMAASACWPPAAVCLSVCRTPPVRPLTSSRIASSHVRCLLLRCAPTPTSSSACRPRRCSQRRSVQSLSGTQACTCVRAGVPGCALARACLGVRLRAYAWVCVHACACVCSSMRVPRDVLRANFEGIMGLAHSIPCVCERGRQSASGKLGGCTIHTRLAVSAKCTAWRVACASATCISCGDARE
jgi:hypothetical protein